MHVRSPGGRNNAGVCPVQQGINDSNNAATSSRPHCASPRADGNPPIKVEVGSDTLLLAVSTKDTLTSTTSDKNGRRQELARKDLASPDAHYNAIKSETDDEEDEIARVESSSLSTNRSRKVKVPRRISGEVSRYRKQISASSSDSTSRKKK